MAGFRAVFVGVLIALAAGVGAVGSAATVRRGCAVPVGAHLVAQDSSARIVYVEHQQPGVNLPLREWRYCWRKSGGYHALVTGGSTGSGAGGIVDVSQIALSGPWAAWATTTIPYGGRYGYPVEGAVSARYLGGRKTQTFVVSSYNTCCYDRLLLTTGGVAAWEVELFAGGGSTGGGPGFWWALQAMNGHTGKGVTLASSSVEFGQSPPDPYSDLQIDACLAGCVGTSKTIAWWSDDGFWYSAPAP